MRLAIRLAAVCLVALAIRSPVLADQDSKHQHFLTAVGSRLFDGEQEFRFISFNIPNLHVIEDNFAPGAQTPWRWPTTYEIEDAFESVRQMGGTVVRLYVISVFRAGSSMGRHVHVLAPGEFHERAFRVLDEVLALANRHGIRVIIPLVDNWKWFGGVDQYAAFRGLPGRQFWTDAQLREDFKQTIKYTIERVNTITGDRYAEDRAIFGWETGNELDAPPEWTSDIAAYIQRLDPNHLVIDGNSLHGVRQQSLTDPHLDVLTTHHYPRPDGDMVADVREAIRAVGGRKPYFVGEFGFVETPVIKGVLREVIDSDASGALLWSLRFHRREGGFYWHSEPAGLRLYKAYHWPGFTSGAPYDESQVLSLMRASAFRMRGLAIPPRAPPAPPRLLPTDSAAHLSWRGSAGASGYDVQRSSSAEGPWLTIGDHVSDAAVAYRPLFSDPSAQVGGAYFYRVIARNAAGESLPSNTVGPVKVRRLALVDELRDATLMRTLSGGRFETTDARRTREDLHRLCLAPGDRAVYETAGPIGHWTVQAYFEQADVNLEFSGSRDGQSFAPWPARRRGDGAEKGDYNYARPVLLESAETLANARFLQVALPATESADESRAPFPVQLSWLEIEHSATAGQPPTAATVDAARRACPLESMIGLFSVEDIRRGPELVDRMAELGDKRVLFCINVYCQLDEQRQVESYGVLSRKRRRRQFVPMNAQVLGEFRAGLVATFARAAHHGLQIAILPHLDAPDGTWRNFFDFDPRQKYGDYDYQSVMIDSIVQALTEAAADAPVLFALSGEMGRALFHYPVAHHEMLTRIRRENPAGTWKVGIELNHNNIAGEYKPSETQLEQLQQLIDACDFVGFSNYQPVSVPPMASDFVQSTDSFLGQLSAFGLMLPAQVELHFSECGIGGYYDDQLTRDPELAALQPYAGTGNPAANPWDDAAMRQLRVGYHAALLDFLATQPGPRPITAAFLWSYGSWDPHGLRWPAFADTEISQAIRKHNARMGIVP